ncbi:SigB/SigF/SigG family RNA polymerase sigma factor [Streptomyces genisteinicus]|uniref:SigB/SigF/SigG family RNA polymerase sigma factor n=1 Tax=Streptomyces genisteinicus TaxID=2768068 RepID=UPI003CCE2025
MTTHVDQAAPSGAEAASPTRAPEGAVPLPPDAADGTAVAPADARRLSRVFLDRLRDLDEGTRAHQYTRNTLIEMNVSLVKYVAGRYRNRGSGDLEDVVQVGTVGLIKAIDRYDPDRENEFTSFAIPYINGEIMRYFRDTSWAVHVPRRLQELRRALVTASELLASRLGRDPTAAELSDHLGVPREEVVEGLKAKAAYTAASLDTPSAEHDGPPGDGRALAETLGRHDTRLDLFENLHTLAPLLESIPARDRDILRMRFGQDMTQRAIGLELGISQMHVSRRIARSLETLRAGLLED